MSFLLVNGNKLRQRMADDFAGFSLKFSGIRMLLAFATQESGV
jgi:hypothetical protein